MIPQIISMTQNMFDNLKDKLAIWLDEPPQDVKAQKDNKRQDDTTANLLNKTENIVHKQADIFYCEIFRQTCSHLKYKNMTDLELDNNIIKKIHNKMSAEPDPEQPLQHADLPENKTLTEITEDDSKTPDSLHKSL
ncbi:hypothetical protein CIHG_09749 [Coccidioides immitis H538.4]|uniref:Uncharacterized protein n=1 Tax=Coccidioides immitis H538.4 TaxID=396776 RepID=A0A0J8S532_COCIT|nr:hypothetical protein CIHG_09749 [Coccidioides immitis H538.4]